MSHTDLTDWLDEQSRRESLWFAKRLSANDTLANNAHQFGPYIPKNVLFAIFPSLNRPEDKNPDVRLRLQIDSHKGERKEIRAIWYNSRPRGGGTRDESRMTGFGGRSSPFLDPENTGALILLVFPPGDNRQIPVCRAWVCRNASEEDLVEDLIGPVEPGKGFLWAPEIPVGRDLVVPPSKERSRCWLLGHEIPPEWFRRFPSGTEIIKKTLEFRPLNGEISDKRLLKRRECEYEIFQSVEEAIELPVIRRGFSSVSEFVDRAQTILQRRKSRSGKSLELHLREIFLEDGLSEGIDFSGQAESEPGKRPDFIFPSEAAYRNPLFPSEKLRMLAAKTTCKDRWRQILNEADRIQVKHLLTLQEGVSENQFKEMTEAGVKLVVPRSLHDFYPKNIRQNLVSLNDFIYESRSLGAFSQYGGESIAAEEEGK